MYALRAVAIIIQNETFLISNLPKGVQWSFLVSWHTEAVHGSDRVDHSFALVEERGVAHRGVEVSVVEQVALVALIGLDALTPALNLVHRGKHGLHIVRDCRLGTHSAPTAHDCLRFELF